MSIEFYCIFMGKIIKRSDAMNSISIGNGVFNVKREFTGNRKVRDIIIEHTINFQQDKSHLTNNGKILYDEIKGSVLVQEEL